MMTHHEPQPQHGIATPQEIVTLDRQLDWNAPWPGQESGLSLAYAKLDGLRMRGLDLDGLVLFRAVNTIDRSVLVTWAVRDTSRPHTHRGEWPSIVGLRQVSPATRRLAELEHARQFG